MSKATILERERSRSSEDNQDTKAPSDADAVSNDGPDHTVPPETPGGGGGLVRVTVNLTPRAALAMEQLCEMTGYSKTDVINRALHVYKVWQKLAERNDGQVVVKHPDGETERIQLI